MTPWQLMMLNMKPADIPAGAVLCAYCGKPVPQPTKRRVKLHCNPTCMRRMQIINRSKQNDEAKDV